MGLKRDEKGQLVYTCDECGFEAPFASTVLMHAFVAEHHTRIDGITPEDVQHSAEDLSMAIKARRGLGREE